MSSRKRQISKPRLLFLHIPKTAGVSLRTIIEAEYPPADVYSRYDLRHEELVASLQEMPPDRASAIRVVLGHYLYGIHEYLPGESTYITVLRDPVDRMISHYHYVLCTPDHYLYEAVTTQKMSLLEYATTGLSAELINGQARVLAGPGYQDCSDASVLEQAKDHLANQCAVVGLTREFAETVRRMQRVFGWSDCTVPRANVNTQRPPLEAVPEAIRQQIAETNRLDMELYQFAEDLFCRQGR